MGKRRRPQFWHGPRELVLTRYLLVVALAVGLALSWGLVRALRGNDPVFARVESSPISGTRGVASMRASAAFDALARMPLESDHSNYLAVPIMAENDAAPANQEVGPRLQPQESRAPDSPSPSASFLALEDDNTRVPPNTMGAAGPNHLMVTLNSQVRIQDKTGTNLSTTSLQNFWSPVGPFTTTTGVFGPRLNYDPYDNRWIAAAAAEPLTTTSSVLVAASQTNDPTGTWNFYRVDVDAGDLYWADTPNLGFNKDWIVLQVDLFRISDGIYNQTKIFVFDKADLYAGGSGNYTVLTLAAQGRYLVPAATYDDALATMYLVKNWDGDDGAVGIWRITGSVGSEVISFLSYVYSINLWEDSPMVGWHDFAPQLGDVRLIMNNDARIQNVVYRNGSIWAAHTVFLPSNGSTGSIGTRSAIQWWEIDPTTPTPSVIQVGRIDDATGNTFYAFPSIGVNQDNDVLIGYSRFSDTQYASANYAYRDHADAPNTLQADTVLKAGEAKYDKEDGDQLNRWGDYSHTVVDPSNNTDFWTIQQYAALPSGGFDRWGTWWGSIVPPGPPTATPTPTITHTPTPSGTPAPSATPTQTNTPGPTNTPGVLEPASFIPMVYKEYMP